MSEAGQTVEHVGQGVVQKVRQGLKAWLMDRMPTSVEDEWVGAYQKIVDQLNPGKPKEVFQKLEGAFRTYGKIAGVSSLVGDAALSGILGHVIFTSRPDLAKQSRQAKVPWIASRISTTNAGGPAERFYAKRQAPWAMGAALGTLAFGPARQLHRVTSRVAGDHVGTIINKITGFGAIDKGKA